MSLPDQTPPVPKWPFIAADVILVGTAWLISASAPHPFSTGVTATVVGCVVAAAAIVVIPFLTDYARRQDQALDERQRALEALTQTLTAAAEQIGIAASGMHAIAELVQKNLRQADHLPQRMQEKTAEFAAQLANTVAEDKEELEREVAALRAAESERLEAIAASVARASAEWAKAEAAAREHVAAAQTAVSDLDTRIAALQGIVIALRGAPASGEAAERARPQEGAAPAGRPAESSEASPAAPTAPAIVPLSPRVLTAGIPHPRVSADPAEAEEPTVSPPRATAGTSDDSVKAPPTRKRPSPKIAAPEFALDFGLEPGGSVPAGAPAEAAPDDVTRLVVTAYIGIGNRLFIRGDGPGLRWEEGLPLQFVSIGKWRWETAHATTPVRFKLYKNDQWECTSVGEGTIQPGEQLEVHATF